MNNEQIIQRINEILKDDRMLSKTALIQINAPLTMIQCALETELHTLQKVLGHSLTNIKELRNE